MMNKKVISAAIVAVFVLSALVTIIPADVSEADDSPTYWETEEPAKHEGYYLIRTPQNLAWVQNGVENGSFTYMVDQFRLVADLDMSGKNLNPIGNEAVNKPFQYEFDGNGHKISGLKIEQTVKNTGLFGYATIGTNIHDLVVESPTITSDKNNSGGIVGNLYAGTVERCAVIGGTISGDQAVGGIVGQNDTGTVSECYNTSTVKGGSNYTGGIIGHNYSTTPVRNCFNAGAVSGAALVAGIVGLNHNAGEISYCYNSGTISGTNPNSGPISGIVGNNFSTGKISFVYNIGTINGSRQTDIAGNNSGGGEISNAYWLANAESAAGARTVAQMTGITAFEKMGGFERSDWMLKANEGDVSYAPQLVKFATAPASEATIAISVESVTITPSSEGGSGEGGSGEGGSGSDNPDDGGDDTLLYVGIAAVAVVAVIGLLWFFVFKP